MRAVSFRDRLPNMTADETYCEMMYVLWRAASTYSDQSVPFPAWFWTLWGRHKVSYLRHWSAQKRGGDREVVADLTQDDAAKSQIADIGVGFEEDYMVRVCPCHGIDPLENDVWIMLAEGWLPNDIIEELGLSRRRYYRIINVWKEKLSETDI